MCIGSVEDKKVPLQAIRSRFVSPFPAQHGRDWPPTGQHILDNFSFPIIIRYCSGQNMEEAQGAYICYWLVLRLSTTRSFLLTKRVRGYTLGDSGGLTGSTYGNYVEMYVQIILYDFFFNLTKLVILVSYAGYHAEDIPVRAPDRTDVAYVCPTLIRERRGWY